MKGRGRAGAAGPPPALYTGSLLLAQQVWQKKNISPLTLVIMIAITIAIVFGAL